MDLKQVFPPQSPSIQKLFELRAHKLQKKLVQVDLFGFTHNPKVIHEKDFTLGLAETNLEIVDIPINKIGQVVGFGYGGAPVCRVLLNQDVYHISAMYLKPVASNKT
jgi:hypothetical protein